MASQAGQVVTAKAITYPGRADIDTESIYGADKHGNFFRVESVTYDAESDSTTVDFEIIPPHELDDFMAAKMAKIEDKARIIAALGGRW
jgi:hypothetical protein